MIQSINTPGPGPPYGKVTKTQENIKTQKSKEASPFPDGDRKAAMNTDKAEKNNKRDPQKK